MEPNELRELLSETSKIGIDTQGKREETCIRHPDGKRPDSAAGSKGLLRATTGGAVFSIIVWLPAIEERP